MQNFLVNENFNSIKVRLEPEKDNVVSSSLLFQFHKGTIRTEVLTVPQTGVGRFQFHKGTIRTPLNLRHKCPYIKWVCECKDTKILQKKCRCLMIFFLRSYDNLPIYGGLNKSKSTFVGFA